MTAEQLEASRAERMRQNGRGQITLDDARTWLEETGLCLFLPRRQFATFTAPTFVEAVAGERNSNPGVRLTTFAEDLLIRLEAEGVAVRLNLLGQPGEQPDFVVAGWVLPYVYALRGDRDWRRSPQLTGSRQVSPLAIQTYKLLEAGDATIPQLKHALGREVSESAVLRAITELWQQLRIIPVVSAPGKTAQWQLLRLRFQKAIAEGASTSQVTAISVLASIYLQAVIAASMEEVELFLAPLTARSKVREVLRGLVATRQVHTLALGHAPHFYVAGTLPEFDAPPTVYASAAMPASTSFLRSYEGQGATHEAVLPGLAAAASTPAATRKPQESTMPRIAASGRAPARQQAQVDRPHFSRQPAHARSRKPAQGAAGRNARRANRDVRAAASRSSGSRAGRSSGHANGARWAQRAVKNGHANGHGNGHGKASGTRSGKGSSNGSRSHSNGNARMGHRPSAAARKDVRSQVRGARGSRKPALSAATKAGNRSRYGFTASNRQRSKKRG